MCARGERTSVGHNARMALLDEPKYLSVTTFKKDGTPVATPVWCVAFDDAAGEALRVVTQADSGKVKRLRNNSSVLIAPCDARGRLRGEQVSATARLLGDADISATVQAITRRYGLLGRFLMWRNERRAAKSGVPQAAAIEIRCAVPRGDAQGRAN